MFEGRVENNDQIAFAKNNATFILEYVTDDITWIMVSDQTIQGKANFTAALARMKDNEVVEVRIDNVITHGDTAAVNGRMKMKDGNVYAFCPCIGPAIHSPYCAKDPTGAGESPAMPIC